MRPEVHRVALFHGTEDGSPTVLQRLLGAHDQLLLRPAHLFAEIPVADDLLEPPGESATP